MNKYIKIGSYILTALIGGALGATLFPKVEVKTETKEVVRWKTKVETVEVEKKVYVDRVKTKVIERIIRKKDGTVITEKVSSSDKKHKTARVEKDVSKKVAEKEQSETSIKFQSKSSFSLGLGVDVLSGDFTPGISGYSLHINKRVYSSPIWTGISVNMDNNWKFDGLSVSFTWEF